MDNIIAKEKLLDGPSNFKIWRDVVENVFEKEDLYDLLGADDESDGSSAGEDSNVTNIIIDAERRLLRRRKRRAVEMLKLTVTPKVLTFIRHLKDPTEIWRLLNDKYHTHTIADAMALRNKWTAVRMTAGMDVSTFMQIVGEILSVLRYAGVVIDNDTTVHKILIELPQRFKKFVRSVQQETVMPTLENLGARLHLEESNMKLRAGNMTEEALVMRIRHAVRSNQARGRFPNYGSSGSGGSGSMPQHGGNFSQPTAGRFDQSRAANSNRQELMCFRCGQPGHISRYCLAPSSVVQQPPKPGMSAHLEELYTDSTNDETIQIALEALALEEDNEWIIDSGASRHFSRNAQAFNSIEPSSLGGTTVSVGGISHPIQGQGNINLSSSSGEIKRISSV
jgi:hypothetical protein